MSMRLKRLELTRDETLILRDVVVDKLVRQHQHVKSQEVPSVRAYEILDTLQSLRDRLRNLAYFLP